MAKSSVVHATFVVERTLNATPAEVFNAFADQPRAVMPAVSARPAGNFARSFLLPPANWAACRA